MKLLLCAFAVLIPDTASVGEMLHRDQDLPQKVVRLEEELHRALHQGDFNRVIELLPEAERLESQLLEILEDPRRDAHTQEGLPPLLEIIGGLRRDAARLVAERGWRHRPHPRIERPPDPKLISVSPEEDGQAIITGAPGAAGDTRARIVRIVNLFTSDQAAALVRKDGSFKVRLIAPPGSSIQISTSMNEDLPEELRRGLASQWGFDLTNLGEEFHGIIQGDRSCSPSLVLPVIEHTWTPIFCLKANFLFCRKLRDFATKFVTNPSEILKISKATQNSIFLKAKRLTCVCSR